MRTRCVNDSLFFIHSFFLFVRAFSLTLTRIISHSLSLSRSFFLSRSNLPYHFNLLFLFPFFFTPFRFSLALSCTPMTTIFFHSCISLPAILSFSVYNINVVTGGCHPLSISRGVDDELDTFRSSRSE